METSPVQAWTVQRVFSALSRSQTVNERNCIRESSRNEGRRWAIPFYHCCYNDTLCTQGNKYLTLSILWHLQVQWRYNFPLSDTFFLLSWFSCSWKSTKTKTTSPSDLKIWLGILFSSVQSFGWAVLRYSQVATRLAPKTCSKKKKFLDLRLLALRNRKAGSWPLSHFPYGEMSKLPQTKHFSVPGVLPGQTGSHTDRQLGLPVFSNLLKTVIVIADRSECLCVITQKVWNRLLFAAGGAWQGPCFSWAGAGGGGLARECVCVHVCACAAPPSSAARPMSGDKAALWWQR